MLLLLNKYIDLSNLIELDLIEFKNKQKLECVYSNS